MYFKYAFRVYFVAYSVYLPPMCRYTSIKKIAIRSSPSQDRARFLADRTNGRAYATVLRLSSSSVVCDVMYCG